MLQQTQVQTVLERFYHPFLAAFPTLQALADAPEDAVMKQWEGLGYYTRARNLHRAARQSAPTLPKTYDELLRLPGIGQNTAHAIMAFAYHRPFAVMEANVKRVLHRMFALKIATPAELWKHAQTLLDAHHPFDYNQAMMDVGAIVCTPKSPDCAHCPASSICLGKQDPLAYPTPKEKRKTPIRTKNILVLKDASSRYFLTPRTTRFLGGLYGFIELEKHQQRYERYRLRDARKLGPVTQTYSHFQLQAEVYELSLDTRMNASCWFNLEDIASLPLSKADIKIVKLLTSFASDAPEATAATN